MERSRVFRFWGGTNSPAFVLLGGVLLNQHCKRTGLDNPPRLLKDILSCHTLNNDSFEYRHYTIGSNTVSSKALKNKSVWNFEH